MRLVRNAVALFIPFLVGCGGFVDSDAPSRFDGRPGVFEGTVGGVKLEVVEAILLVRSNHLKGTVVVGDTEGLCERARAAAELKGHEFVISLQSEANSSPIAGTYPV